MTSTAHGKQFETEFCARWQAIDGKRAWWERLVDSSDLYGANGGLVNAPTSPADFILAYDGWLGLADCKATKDPKGFAVALVKKPQFIAATKSVASGTNYVFPIKAMKTGNVFFVPARAVLSARGTILWEDLAPFLWSEDMKCPITLMSCSTSRPLAPGQN